MPSKSKSNLFVIILTLSFALVLTGVNLITGPIIGSGNKGAEVAVLNEVLSGAEGWECIYNKDDAANSSLENVSESIASIWQETSGKGYGFKLSTTKGFTGEAIEFAIGIDAEGKITSAKLTAYPESKDFGASYPATYVGQDASLNDVQIVAGVTYSSQAFKWAVEDAFNIYTTQLTGGNE